MTRQSRPHRTHQNASWTAYLLLLVMTLASCASPTPTEPVFPKFILITQDPNASPTPTPFQPSGSISTSVASFTPETATPTIAPPTETSTPIPASSTPSTDPVATSAPPPTTTSRTNYILYATMDFEAHTLNVDETVRYYNNSGTALSDIVLSVQPNQYGNVFTLNSISQDNAALTSFTLNDQRLTLNLPQPLQTNSATTLTLNFELNIPAKTSSGLFGYDFNQTNLVDWYPFVVPYEGGWILHDPMPWGEHLVYDSSDIELNLKTSADVIVAIGAPSEQNGEWTRYRLYGARTMALSASNEFLVSESTAGSVVIRSYYFDGYKTGGDGILGLGKEAIDTFSTQYAPYPHQSLAIVQTDIHDGQEYDGLVFLSSDFYSQYTGSERGNLATIGVHEIAHQWWFGLVGNDQALEPWLDEALAIYSERIFFENNYPADISWWWQFRVDFFKPGGYVDTNIYNGGSFRVYTNAVYLNGAHFLDDLRQRMGYGNFAKFLREYARRYSYGHATSTDFFAVMRETVNVDISDLLAEYFSGSY